MENESFFGQGWSFPPEFYANGGEVELVAGEEDIRQSLLIILSTATGERTMFSQFGCALSQFMFEEIDQGLINGLQNLISDALLNNEPRIRVISVNIGTTGAQGGVVLIQVEYLVRTTNNRYNLVYPFYIFEASLTEKQRLL